MLSKALLVRLEALPGKERELADFLVEARSIVMEEPGTVAWFAIQFGPSSFGVYDVFPDDEARRRIATRIIAEHSFDKRAETLIDDAVRAILARR